MNFCFTSRITARKSDPVGRSIFVNVIYESHKIAILVILYATNLKYFYKLQNTSAIIKFKWAIPDNEDILLWRKANYSRQHCKY